MKIKKILRLSAEDSGGRNRTRTCDPIDVNDVLYQLSHATKICYRFLCNLHIPSVRGVLRGNGSVEFM